jgi:hypothetical protein
MMRLYAPNRGMDCGELLACRSLRHLAGTHPFVLRTEHSSAATSEELDFVLEESRHTALAEP